MSLTHLWLWPAWYLFNDTSSQRFGADYQRPGFRKEHFPSVFSWENFSPSAPEGAGHPCIPATAAAGGKAGDADPGGALHGGFSGNQSQQLSLWQGAASLRQEQRMGGSNSPAQQREALLVQLSAAAESSSTGLM